MRVAGRTLSVAAPWSLEAVSLDVDTGAILNCMDSLANRVTKRLAPLVGLPLALSRRAADLRGFHFGEIRALDGSGTAGEYILHVQCPWRLEREGNVYTGRGDLWEPASGVEWSPEWDYEQGNLQDERVAELLRDRCLTTGSPMSTAGEFVVQRAIGLACGGASIALSGGLTLVLFPHGSLSEDWRLLQYRGPHFVISGGREETDEDDSDSC